MAMLTALFFCLLVSLPGVEGFAKDYDQLVVLSTNQLPAENNLLKKLYLGKTAWKERNPPFFLFLTPEELAKPGGYSETLQALAQKQSIKLVIAAHGAAGSDEIISHSQEEGGSGGGVSGQKSAKAPLQSKANTSEELAGYLSRSLLLAPLPQQAAAPPPAPPPRPHPLPPLLEKKILDISLLVCNGGSCSFDETGLRASFAQHLSEDLGRRGVANTITGRLGFVLHRAQIYTLAPERVHSRNQDSWTQAKAKYSYQDGKMTVDAFSENSTSAKLARPELAAASAEARYVGAQTRLLAASKERLESKLAAKTAQLQRPSASEDDQGWATAGTSNPKPTTALDAYPLALEQLKAQGRSQAAVTEAQLDPKPPTRLTGTGSKKTVAPDASLAGAATGERLAQAHLPPLAARLKQWVSGRTSKPPTHATAVPREKRL